MAHDLRRYDGASPDVFVLLIVISSPDPGKFDQAMKSIADALGAVPVSTETLMVAEKESEASFENLGSQVKEIIN